MASLYADHARELAAVGPEWHMASWRHHEETKTKPERLQVVLMTAPLLANGQVAWKYADRKGKKVVLFTLDEHRFWLREWEHRTGLCYQCSPGKPGFQWVGWKQGEGDRFEKCQRCRGKGVKP